MIAYCITIHSGTQLKSQTCFSQDFNHIGNLAAVWFESVIQTEKEGSCEKFDNIVFSVTNWPVSVQFFFTLFTWLGKACPCCLSEYKLFSTNLVNRQSISYMNTNLHCASTSEVVRADCNIDCKVQLLKSMFWFKQTVPDNDFKTYR